MGTTGQDNCRRRETATHLLLCPSEDRTQSLIDNADELEKWLEKDGSTDQDLAYWDAQVHPNAGRQTFCRHGSNVPMALAQSQDKIGDRNFMEGHISTNFYEIQNFHLAMTSSFLNGADWAKQFISKIFHITHSQWIFRNFSLHDKRNGYLHNKKAEEIALELGRTSPGRCPSQQPIFT